MASSGNTSKNKNQTGARAPALAELLIVGSFGLGVLFGAAVSKLSPAELKAIAESFSRRGKPDGK